MKKIIIFLFATILILAGCSSSDNDSSSLTVWAMGAEGALLPELTDKYTEETGVDVEVVAIPWDQANEKLTTSLASGEGPDVVQMGNTWMPQFVDAQAIIDLSEFAMDNENFDLDLYFDGAAETSMYQGVQYAVPWYVDTRALYVRTDLTEEYCGGIPSTQDELFECAVKLGERGDNLYGMDWDVNEATLVSQIAWGNGWDYQDSDGNYQFDSQIYIDALDYLNDYKVDGATLYDSGLDILNTFFDDTVPMFVSGPWMVQSLTDAQPDRVDEWTVVPMPEGSTGNSTVQGGTNWTIWADSTNIEGGADFINWMMSEENQIQWYKMASALPARQSVWDETEFTDDEYLPIWNEQLNVAKPVPNDANYEAIGQFAVSGQQETLLSDVPASDAATHIEEQTEDLE